MLPGFEDITFSLTESEMQWAVQIANGLSKRIGPENAITSDEIIKSYLEKRSVKLTGPRIRKIVNYIRMHDMVPCLVASSKGYYVTNDPKDLQRYAASLTGRAQAIQALILNVERDIKKLQNAGA